MSEHHDSKTCPKCLAITASKKLWGPGPWQNEPDRVDFEHKGLPCFIKRNKFGAWCGYAGVPKGHPLYEKDYEDNDLRVHGGPTYANRCAGCLCHIPKPGETDDIWWFGFDCNHGGDHAPGVSRHLQGVYRDQAYAMKETKSLAKQLSIMKE